MKNFAPQIYRKRLIVEGIYKTNFTELDLKNFMTNVSKEMGMTILLGPIVKNMAGEVNPFHSGYEGVLVWAESGMSLYTWSEHMFFSADIYSCKEFNTASTVELLKNFFEAVDIDFKEV